MTGLPRGATGTSRAVVRLAMRDAQAVYWHDEVFVPGVSNPTHPSQQGCPRSGIGCIHVRQEGNIVKA
eukprot:11865019-Prorocentrum_lima.AAC.1